MIKEWISNIRYWIASRDFISTHIRLVKSEVMCSMYMCDDNGLTASIYSSEPEIVKMVNDIINKIDQTHPGDE